MIAWLKGQWARIQARKFAAEQQQKLRKHRLQILQETQTFLESLGKQMKTKGLPPRCPYIYEAILDWAKNDRTKIAQAALYLFLWELEEKRLSLSWEVSDITLEIEQRGNLATR